MKALKEKRTSLRSFLRSSLFVLSILALAFAFAACGNGNNNDGGPGNGGGNNGGGNGNGPAPAITALSITILTQPAPGNLQFEAMPPDLTGTTLSVQWSNGTTETVINMADFFTIPSNILLASPGDHPEFRIAHRGSTVTSQPFHLNTDFPSGATLGDLQATTTNLQRLVIPLIDANLSRTGPVVWFNDQRPDFSNLVLQGTWEWRGAGNRLGTPTDSMTANIPMSPTFPGFSMEHAPTRGIVTTSVGYTHPNPQLPAWERSRHPTSNANPADFSFDFEISLDAFYEVISVEFRNAGPNFLLYDDHFMTTIASPTEALPVSHPVIRNLFRDNDAQFRVFYTGGRYRDILWPEFIGNREFFFDWAYGFGTPAVDLDAVVVGHDGQITAATATPARPIGTLNWNDEEGDPVWNVVLEYVFINYNQLAWVTRFPVEVPVFVFDELTAVTRRPGTGTANIWIPAASASDHTVVTDFVAFPTIVSATQGTSGTPGTPPVHGSEVRRALNDFYQVWANYERGPVSRSRAIPWDRVQLGQHNDGLLGRALLWPMPPAVANVPDATEDWIHRDFLLHIWYRGTVLNDDEEDLLVDLQWVGNWQP